VLEMDSQSSPLAAGRGPAAKRRRISASSRLEISPQPMRPGEEDGYGRRYGGHGHGHGHGGGRLAVDDVAQSSDEEIAVAVDDVTQSSDEEIAVGGGGDGGSESPMSVVEEGSQSGADDAVAPAPGHPVFQRPPRFKAVEAAPDPVQQCQLPVAFSPQRRGAQYVAGGLAGELRDWLVQIKGRGQDGDPGGFTARLVVDHVRSAPGMFLVRGRPIRDGSTESEPESVGVILAGEGRTTGLARNRVVEGSIIGIAQPAWDVVLENRTRWAVACDWGAL